MRRTTRLHRAVRAAVAALALVRAAHAQGRFPLPDDIVPQELERLLADNGLADFESWLEADEAMMAHADRVERDVDPLYVRLMRESTAQFWINWPSLKPKPIRELRNRAFDAVMQSEQALFADLIGRARVSHPDRVPLVESAGRAWLRRRLPAVGSFPFAQPIDLVEVLRQSEIDVSTDAASVAVVRAWESGDLSRRVSALRLRRALDDRFDEALAREGLEVGDLHGEGNPSIARAFEIWHDLSEPLLRAIDVALAADRAAVDAIAAFLPEADAERLRWHHFASSCTVPEPTAVRMWARQVWRMRADDELDAEDPAELRRIGEEWLALDTSLARAIARHALGIRLVQYWPLWGSGWWADREVFPDASREISLLLAQREEAVEAMARRLAALEGDRWKGHVERAERTDLETRARLRGSPAPESWPISPHADVHRGGPSGVRLPLDPGPLGTPDLDGIADMVGMDDDERAILHALGDAARERYRETLGPLGGEHAKDTGWRYEESGYRYDSAYGDARRVTALEARRALEESEARLFEDCAATLSSEEARQRLAVARWSRAIDRDLHLLRCPSPFGLDRRGLSNPARAARIALESGATPGVGARHLADAVRSFASLTRRRAEACEELVSRHADLADRAMWQRGELGARLRRQMSELERQIHATDRELRSVAVREADAIVALAATGCWRAAVLRRWDAIAFPLLLERDPPALAALEAAVARGQRLDDVEIVAERFRSRDGALVLGLRELAIASGDASDADEETELVRQAELERIGRRRNLVSNLALCSLLRLAREGDPSSGSRSDGR